MLWLLLHLILFKHHVFVQLWTHDGASHFRCLLSFLGLSNSMRDGHFLKTMLWKSKLYCPKVVRGRLALLSAHLAAPHSVFDAVSSSTLERSCVSSAQSVPPPPNLRGALTIIDERTGKKYQVQISSEDTVKATNLKKITAGSNDKGPKLYNLGYLNIAPVRSSICYIDGDAGILRYRGYPIDELADGSSFVEVAYLLLYGNLPSESQLADWEFAISQHSAVPQGILGLSDILMQKYWHSKAPIE